MTVRSSSIACSVIPHTLRTGPAMMEIPSITATAMLVTRCSLWYENKATFSVMIATHSEMIATHSVMIASHSEPNPT